MRNLTSDSLILSKKTSVNYSLLRRQARQKRWALMAPHYYSTHIPVREMPGLVEPLRLRVKYHCCASRIYAQVAPDTRSTKHPVARVSARVSAREPEPVTMWMEMPNGPTCCPVCLEVECDLAFKRLFRRCKCCRYQGVVPRLDRSLQQPTRYLTPDVCARLNLVFLPTVHSFRGRLQYSVQQHGFGDTTLPGPEHIGLSQSNLRACHFYSLRSHLPSLLCADSSEEGLRHG